LKFKIFSDNLIKEQQKKEVYIMEQQINTGTPTPQPDNSGPIVIVVIVAIIVLGVVLFILFGGRLFGTSQQTNTTNPTTNTATGSAK
jgi:hypothetical protein